MERRAALLTNTHNAVLLHQAKQGKSQETALTDPLIIDAIDPWIE